jgi:hypothetical protein
MRPPRARSARAAPGCRLTRLAGVEADHSTGLGRGGADVAQGEHAAVERGGEDRPALALPPEEEAVVERPQEGHPSPPLLGAPP